MINLFNRKFYKTLRMIYDLSIISKEAYLKTLNIYKYNGVLTCEICKKPINNQDGLSGKHCSIDHIIPRFKGGTELVENLRIAHRDCNSGRKYRN